MHEEATNISIPGTVATSTTTTQNQNDTTETITINNDEVHLDMTPEDNNENLDVPFSSETPESKIAREIGVDIVRNISLPCLLSNKNVMWVHEGKGAVINPLHVLENGSLSLTQVDRKDSGVYTCSVDGEDDASVRLRVRTPPPQLSFTVHPSTILALLIWTVNETGGYPIIYFTAQYRLGNSDEEWKIISPTRISPNIRQIEVYKLEPNTTYGFQIWATNQLGKGEITEVHEHALFNNQELVTDVEASIDGGGSQSVMDMTMGHCYSLAPNAVSSAEIPDTKFGIEELCPVCGDKVSGYHYGLLTCESCKGFFKRTVQNKKVYTCVAERSCHIDKTQRKRCPFCRFQKCLEVGMKLEAVRADRMRGGRNKFGPMYKRDRARKLQIMRQRQLAIQALAQRGQLGEGGVYNNQAGTSPFNNIHIKQEIQIPQVSSLTSSPDSPSSPNAVVLGQVSSAIIQPTSSQQSSLLLGVSGTQSPVVMGPDGKIWSSANSTTTSPHSLSPKTFHFDTVLPGGSVPPSSKISPLIRDFVQAIDDREWQNSLYSLLQNQTYNQCEVDLFELMCKVLDQNLFSQVDWARNSIIFKELKVDDQMKLLQHSWSDMLVLDHMHQRMHNNLPDETTLHNGQKFDLLSLGLLGVSVLADPFNNITAKLLELKFDVSDYICVKFLLLLNPDVRGITNRKLIQDGYDQVHQALLDYTVTCYPQIPYKFHKLLQLLPEMHSLATRGEEHLYHKHCTGGAPTQTLLMEMLHAKRK